MSEQFIRTEMILGHKNLDILAGSRVAVFGVGGVGGYVVEALARSGVGTLDLIDNDVVSESNINRQIIALHSTIGQPKVEVAARRVHDINPNCKVNIHQTFYLPETADQFDFSEYDYVVDAIDTVAGKLELVMRAQSVGTPIICSMGTGNKMDPTRFKIADIYKTDVCPLAKVMRRECKKRGIKKLKVLYSTELPVETIKIPGTEPDPSSSRRSTPGSTPFCPSAAGLIIAAEVVKDLTSFDPANR